MATATVNLYAEAARAMKAANLAFCLGKAGIPASDVALMDDAHWAMAAQAADVRIPSGETRRLVLDIMRRRERRPNPFPKR
ncbi:MAG: hypothetical protein U0R19_37550 [Bryobacteraceae bacterium]